MTDREHAAFRLGIRHAADLALIAAVTMECRDGAHAAGPRSAIAALQAFGAALKDETAPTRFALAHEAGLLKSEHTSNSVATERPESIGLVQREAALAAGYTGDPCGSCGNFTMRRNGTCLSCDTCGATTGCS